MWKTIALLFLAGPSFGALSHFWAGNGAYRQVQDDLLPYINCTTCTYTTNWDGDTIRLYSAKNEAVGFAFYMGNNTGADISEVSVTLSSFTGVTVSSGIENTVTVSSTNVWDYRGRPIELFYVRYLEIKGMTQLSWDGSEIEMRDVPERMRRPFTINGNDQGVAVVGSTWTSRQDHNKFYPDILVPYEAVIDSSFTVSASSSQAIWADIWVSSSMPAGEYEAELVVREGVTISTRIPVSLTVANFSLPDTAALKATVYLSGYNINYRHQGDHFPGAGAVYEDSRNRYKQMAHRHKFSSTFGDQMVNYCNNGNAANPCPEYQIALTGALYTATSGYANGPGYGVGDTDYIIGSYGGWRTAQWSSTTTGGFGGFCFNISSWSLTANNYPSAKFHVYLADEVTDFTPVDKWSTWVTTSCVMAGQKINTLATGSWVVIQGSAPNVTTPVATTFLRASSATWQTAQDYFSQGGSTEAWIYNSHPSATGSTYATEDDGIAPTTIFWAMSKMNVPKWLGWEGVYWTDSNMDGVDTEPFSEAMTFGFDTSFNTVKGRTGAGYSNGDGVLFFPGTDLIGAVNYGIDAPFASWRLKMLRRGIQDGDYIEAARAIDEDAANAIVEEMVPEVLWEHHCFDAGDCTYAYGGRSWTNDPDAWEDARLALAAIAEPDEPSVDKVKIQGPSRLRGPVIFK